MCSSDLPNIGSWANNEMAGRSSNISSSSNTLRVTNNRCNERNDHQPQVSCTKLAKVRVRSACSFESEFQHLHNLPPQQHPPPAGINDDPFQHQQSTSNWVSQSQQQRVHTHTISHLPASSVGNSNNGGHKTAVTEMSGHYRQRASQSQQQFSHGLRKRPKLHAVIHQFRFRLCHFHFAGGIYLFIM